MAKANMATAINQDWERLASLAHYDAGELTRLCHISNRQLQRQFLRQFARTPQDWLDEQRLKAAEPLLLDEQPVKVVALKLGYRQSSHFCRRFKDYYHMTPSQFVAMKLASFGKLPPKSNAKVQGHEGEKISSPSLTQPDAPLRLPIEWRCSTFPEVRAMVCPCTPWLPCAKISEETCRAKCR